MILCCESKKKCDWFGLRYPSHADLEAYAWQLGIAVVAGEVPHAAYFPAYDGLPAVIVSPMGGPLETMWAIALAKKVVKDILKRHKIEGGDVQRFGD